MNVVAATAPTASPLHAAWHRACDERDPEFDGVFFVAITSTRIYCRPICPSRRARPENRRFFLSTGAAQHAGFRPCLRCRPDRQLRRAVERVLGVSPRNLAQTHRLVHAKRLLADTDDTMIQIAYVSGFQSLRRFNAAFREQYHTTPREIRRAERVERS